MSELILNAEQVGDLRKLLEYIGNGRELNDFIDFLSDEMKISQDEYDSVSDDPGSEESVAILARLAADNPTDHVWLAARRLETAVREGAST